MNYETYLAHVSHACRTGQPIDPMLAMAANRTAMRSASAKKYGYTGFRRDYFDLRARVTERCHGLMQAENLYRDSILAPAARPLGRMAA